MAISTDGDFVSAHFGRCPSYTIAEIKEGKVLAKEVVDNPGHNPGNIPQFLNEKGVKCIVAGGMGQRAVGFFDQFNIKVIVGIAGRIDDVVEKLCKGSLEAGQSLCNPGDGKGYGLDKSICDHTE
ncbi:MAG: NifB/NifX family molybdenum-iron cluster-binding protein [Candidatus Omnitrophica bacterium]|nr:NifB/NifX family molybdenum-iron cluster-binding protein [Candidatus Omnitrophota bacterium]MDD5429492.1 NifB/NifX family molybdenum-iron cluster-binding protein [Candidatus Omnitrophota bacterium]